jgi:hypothetical protein
MTFSISSNIPPSDEAALDKLYELQQHMERVYSSHLRDDSRLAYLWCVGETVPPYVEMDDVAHELVCVDKIFKETEYCSSSEIVSREKAAIFHSSGIEWKKAWKLVRAHYFDVHKYETMIRAGLTF